MPIRLLLQSSAFEPSEVEALAEAFESVCYKLKIVRIDNPTRALIARKVINFAECGCSDPGLIRAFVLVEMQELARGSRPASALRGASLASRNLQSRPAVGDWLRPDAPPTCSP